MYLINRRIKSNYCPLYCRSLLGI